MEPWLLKQLETKLGGFRSARWQKCTTCHQWTLSGPDNDIAGIPATVDPTPLTPAQEYDAAIHQRTTYTIRQNGKTWHISDRCPYAVARPENLLTVVPAHHCGHRYTPTRPLDPRHHQPTTCPY